MTKSAQLITIIDVQKSKKVQTFLKKGNEFLGAIGFTDHGLRHAHIVSETASDLLIKLGYDERLAQLAAIAGYLHDLGNVVSREDHGQTGAVLAQGILEDMGMDYEEIALVVSAIGNHEEEYGQIVHAVGAALVLADKTDVHRNRVRNRDIATFDIHDRVNYGAINSCLEVFRDNEDTAIILDIDIDTEISHVMEYFEIFLVRMVMCRRAASHLNANFRLIINGTRLL